jgi:hypothetical protein
LARWYDANAKNPPWIKALADVRRRGTLEGYCYQPVQAIMIAIDQYAETGLRNRGYFFEQTAQRRYERSHSMKLSRPIWPGLDECQG